MKLKLNVNGKTQPDPFIFSAEGKLYLYVTASDGVEAYSADELFGEWKYEGIVTAFKSGHNFWAPSVIEYEGKYYMYVSCDDDGIFQHMRVASSDSPLGPFTNDKILYDRFSIDSHVVKTDEGLYLWYAEDNLSGEKIGTRVFLDKLSDPYTVMNISKEVVCPSFDEEIFQRNRQGDGRNWYTIEGPFWFCEGEWQYLMYSGGCFMNDTYHVGYCAAKTSEQDLLKVDYIKHSDNGKFDPVLIKNDFEEGTGHHSVIKYKGEYYAIYHARDVKDKKDGKYSEERTARICRLKVKDGIITAESESRSNDAGCDDKPYEPFLRILTRLYDIDNVFSEYSPEIRENRIADKTQNRQEDR